MTQSPHACWCSRTWINLYDIVSGLVTNSVTCILPAQVTGGHVFKSIKTKLIKVLLYSKERCVLEGSQASLVFLLVRKTCRWKWMSRFGGTVVWEGNQISRGENIVSMPLCPPKISSGLTWDRKQVVRDYRPPTVSEPRLGLKRLKLTCIMYKGSARTAQ